MRDLGFKVALQPSRAGDVIFLIHAGSSYTANELLIDKIVGVMPEAFVALLAASKGLGSSFRIREQSQSIIEMSVQGDLLSEPWHVTSLLNLLNGETFLGNLDNDPFITKVDVFCAWSGNLKSLYDALEAHLAYCREAMTELLPDGFEVDDYTGRAWPEDAPDYMYRLKMTLSQPISSDTKREIDALFNKMDTVLSGSAFELSDSPEEWFESAVVPYPVQVDLSDADISYTVEMPPSDFSPGILLITEAIEANFGVTVRDWEFEIREGW